MQVQSYLFFNGRCEEAIEYYRETLGAEVTSMMRFKEMPDPHPGAITPETENKIMHASVRVGDAVILVSDGMGTGELKFEGFSLTITAPDDAEAERVFSRLSASGEVNMPMEKTFFASRFGMVNDKFGVSWIVLSDL